MNADEIKGFVLLQSVEQSIKKARNDFRAELMDFSSTSGKLSYLGNGWSPISHSIIDGEFLKISAFRAPSRIEAKFNILKVVPDRDNGPYEITGGLFSGRGTFLNIEPKDGADIDFQATDNHLFSRFFICYSRDGRNGVPFLRWRIVLRACLKNKFHPGVAYCCISVT